MRMASGACDVAQVLNYGQSVFEGMKAQRSEAGRIVLFRPDENAARMMAGEPVQAMCSCAAHRASDRVTLLTRVPSLAGCPLFL